MRELLKKSAHFLIKRIEAAKGFYLPDGLPARTKMAFLFGRYERETLTYIRAHVAGDVAIDVGAHVGYFSRHLSPLVKRVYAFEPDPTNFALLVKNTRRFANVTPLNMALSDSSGEQPFFLVPDSTFRHTLVSEGGYPHIMVSTTTVDDFMESKKERVSFVKIDVEGHEQSVLAGMKKTVGKDRPLVICEMPLNDTYPPVSPVIGKMGLVRNYIV